MKRAGRWLCNFVLGVLLLVGPALVLVTFASYFRGAVVARERYRNTMIPSWYQVGISRGWIVLQLDRTHVVGGPIPASRPIDWPTVPVEYRFETFAPITPFTQVSNDHRFFILDYSHTQTGNGHLQDLPGVFFHEWLFRLRISAWAIALPSVIITVWQVRRGMAHLRQYRRENRLCMQCGYDLRATPDRCPECGTAVKQKGKAGQGQASRPAAGA